MTVMASNVFRFEERWIIPEAPPGEVWEVLAHAELLPQWWKGVYLEAEPLGPAGAPRVGGKVRAKARGFLPYRLNFIIEAVELEPGRLVVARTSGDFDGLWRASLSPQGAGTVVDLVWEVVVEQPILRFLAPLLRPAFAWNHRWTTPRGEAGLRAFLRERKTARR
jgi:Polyketide cyclase / dehydrase and lipid transport